MTGFLVACLFLIPFAVAYGAVLLGPRLLDAARGKFPR